MPVKNKIFKLFLMPVIFFCAACDMHSPDPGVWQAWDDSCRTTQNVQINRTAKDVNEYAVTEKDQEVDSKTGKVFYESVYRAVCIYGKNEAMYHCNWQISNVKSRYEYEITAKTLYDNWSDHVRDRNNSVVHAYAVYDHTKGDVMASSAMSRISWPETFMGHLMETHSRVCGEELKAEDVLKPSEE